MTEENWIPTEWSLYSDLTNFDNPIRVRVVRMDSPFYPETRYAVRWGDHHCLNIDGEWEWEPMPSSRDDAFYERCRFKDFAVACDCAKKYRGEFMR